MDLKIRRLLSVFIDLSLSTLFMLLLFWTNIDTDYAFIFGVILFISKDLFTQIGSIGKKIVGLKLTFKGSNKFKYIRLILRNFLSLLWPIEALFILFFNVKIGDFLFKTRVEVER